jgi:predicted acetyltransferase
MARACVREARASGAALSALYPATVALYRGAGYARAGARYEIEIAPGAAATRERSPRVERTTDDDPELRATYARFAARRPGFLDRGPYIWSRVFRPRKGHVGVFKVVGDRGCEGYAAVAHATHDGSGEVRAHDLVALSRPAARRLLELLSAYGSVATSVVWHGAAPDLLTSALSECRHAIRVTDYWMLRICDVERALGARGYAADGALDLAVEDDVAPENRGRFRLRVRGGRATVEPGGDGTFAIDVRGLAALYSGFHDARTLIELGELDARDEDVATADALFAGRAPAMSDGF